MEKKVLGSNGYAFVNLTEEEELKFNLGVLELFFANIGRIDSKKFLKYYCNKCIKGKTDEGCSVEVGCLRVSAA